MQNSSNEVSLRDHLEALLKAEAKRNDDRAKAAEAALITAFTAAKEALFEAKTAAEKLADKQNEWRGSLNDVITTRISREEHEASRKPLALYLSVISMAYAACTDSVAMLREKAT